MNRSLTVSMQELNTAFKSGEKIFRTKTELTKRKKTFSVSTTDEEGKRGYEEQLDILASECNCIFRDCSIVSVFVAWGTPSDEDLIEEAVGYDFILVLS